MKKFLMTLLLASSLGACATGPDGQPILPSPAVIDSTVSQVQAITRQACGFVPIAGTITSFFTTAGATVFDVANAICSALASAPKARRSRDGLVTVRLRTPNGGTATVQGHYVGN